MRRLLLAALIAAPLAAHAACPSDEAVSSLAEAMVAGRLHPPFPNLSMEDAICARGKLVPLLARHWGSVIGYKAGLTSAAVQQRYGLSSPVRGSIFTRTVTAQDGAELPSRVGEVTLGVEPDLLVRVADEGINTAGRDHVAILRHLDRVLPFIELPAAGFAGSIDGPLLVAANVHARLGVVGRAIEPEPTEEFAARLRDMAVIFSDDTREIARARGSALLGHPLDVIPWLVEDLARQGQRLKAGDILSLGGFAPSVPAISGRVYTVRYEGLIGTPVAVSVRMQ